MTKQTALRIVALFLLAFLVFSAAACGEKEPAESGGEDKEPASFGWTKTLDLAQSDVHRGLAPELTGDPASLKIGVILIGDESEGYTKAHIDGINNAAEKLGIAPGQIIWKSKVPENDDAVAAADQLYAEGCRLIISNSYGYQDYMLEAARKHSDAQYIAMTGDLAAGVAAQGEIENYANAFTDVYQSRFVSGAVAGLKLNELLADGALTKESNPNNFDADGNIKIGYVGAYNYAEVISGFTAVFLGIKSVVPNVTMEVYYTNSWFDFDAEKAAAENLIDRGCVIICQHADSAGAPTAAEIANNAGKTVYSVGYNVSMLSSAEHASLTSATNVWEVYYEFAFATVINGDKLPTNWSGGYDVGAVAITELGASCSPDTADYVKDLESKLKKGELQVFDTSKFTYKGKTLTWAYATDTDGNFVYDANNVISDGYFHESYVQSAPAFNIIIDGIKELN